MLLEEEKFRQNFWQALKQQSAKIQINKYVQSFENNWMIKRSSSCSTKSSLEYEDCHVLIVQYVHEKGVRIFNLELLVTKNFYSCFGK